MSQLSKDDRRVIRSLQTAAKQQGWEWDKTPNANIWIFMPPSGGTVRLSVLSPGVFFVDAPFGPKSPKPTKDVRALCRLLEAARGK